MKVALLYFSEEYGPLCHFSILHESQQTDSIIQQSQSMPCYAVEQKKGSLTG